MIVQSEARYPLIGSVQNSVGMGFLGNQALAAVACTLGARVVCAQSMHANAHGNFTGRSSVLADPGQFRRDVEFLINQRPVIIVVGYLPRAVHVRIVAELLERYKGIVLVDPVIGDFTRGLYVSEETARAIKDELLPAAQIITPNRFEADVLIGAGERKLREHEYLNALFDLGPRTVVITSFERDAPRRITKTLFTNGYSYDRIVSPYHPGYPGHGAGDVFAAALATFIAIGGSPFAATLLATALCARSVEHTTVYGGGTVDPVAALAEWYPAGYQVDDARTADFCQKSGVRAEPMPATAHDGPRLKFAPS